MWCYRFLVSVLLLVGGSVSALGGESAVVAVIDPNRIVEQSPQYEAARQQLQQEVAEREQQLLEQQEQLKKLQERLEKDAALMSHEEIQRLKNDIRNRDRRLKYAQAEAREDLTLRQNEMRTRLGKQVEEVVTELAREKKIDLIVSGEDAFYFSERIDLSNEVVERMRGKYRSR